jgi:hypothetical protein
MQTHKKVMLYTGALSTNAFHVSASVRPCTTGPCFLQTITKGVFVPGAAGAPTSAASTFAPLGASAPGREHHSSAARGN